MPHLLNIWPGLSSQLSSAPRVLLLFDYDSALAPGVVHPEISRLPDEVRLCLREVAGKERFIVGVISGRELSELEELVAIPGLIYLGNHGFEMRGLGFDFVHPEASGFIEPLTEIAFLLHQKLKPVPKLLVFHRKLILSINFKGTPDEYTSAVDHMVTSVLDPYVLSGAMKVARGGKVVQVMPNLDWGKGEAIKKVHQGCGDNVVPMFFGDEWDNEDGFAAVQDGGGIAVCIGLQRQATRALHQLESHTEVIQVLELLEDLGS